MTVVLNSRFHALGVDETCVMFCSTWDWAKPFNILGPMGAFLLSDAVRLPVNSVSPLSDRSGLLCDGPTEGSSVEKGLMRAEGDRGVVSGVSVAGQEFWEVCFLSSLLRGIFQLLWDVWLDRQVGQGWARSRWGAALKHIAALGIWIICVVGTNQSMLSGFFPRCAHLDLWWAAAVGRSY